VPQLREPITRPAPVAELTKRGLKKSLILKISRINPRRSPTTRRGWATKAKRRSSNRLTRQGLERRRRQQVRLEALVCLTGQHEVLSATASIRVRPSSSLAPRGLDLRG
jgi:hypothetical protein